MYLMPLGMCLGGTLHTAEQGKGSFLELKHGYFLVLIHDHAQEE